MVYLKIKKSLSTYLKYLPTKKRPKETNGPIPKAYITVPMHTIPPKYHQNTTALDSIIVLVKEKDKLVFF